MQPGAGKCVALPGRFVITPNSFWPFFFFAAASICFCGARGAADRFPWSVVVVLWGAGLPDGVRWTVVVVVGLLASFRFG